MGDLSQNFSRAEFRCRGESRPGHPPHPVIVDPHLLEHLERLRRETGGRPLRIVSGHRCSWWNERAGGASSSQHVDGRAADIPAGYATTAQAQAAGFSGLGISDGWAIHVDVRPVPARWYY